ncbi:hypothetical protein WA158_007080 [Blastocystis sp. Blastoise]
MALNIGNRQVNLDDLDAIIFDNTEIAVDPTTLSSLGRHDKSKGKVQINKIPEIQRIDSIYLYSFSSYENRTLTKEECKAILTFTLLCLLKKGGNVRKETCTYLCGLINHNLIPQFTIVNLYEDIIKCFTTIEFESELINYNITLPGAINDTEKACIENLSIPLDSLSFLGLRYIQNLIQHSLMAFSFTIEAIQGDINAFSEDIYENDRPHKFAMNMSQCIRILLSNSNNTKDNLKEELREIPEVLGCIGENISRLQVSLRVEANSNASSTATATVTNHIVSLLKNFADLLNLNKILLSSLLTLVTPEDSLYTTIQQEIQQIDEEYTKAWKNMMIVFPMNSVLCPASLISLITFINHNFSILTTASVQILNSRIENAAKEEKAKDEEREKAIKKIEEEMAAKRAEEEKGMDEATLAKIRAKRAAKEAKKTKKEKPSKKSIILGLGVTEFLEDIKKNVQPITLDSIDTLLNIHKGSYASYISSVIDKLRSGGIRRKPKLPKGTRDYLPEQMEIREQVFNIIRSVFKRHGAVEIDTPVFEEKDTLTGKYGEDSKLIYDLADQGGEALALRYDLTVPFARYVALHGISQIKRYHMARVYRRDNPVMSKGRFREFYQCDYDIAGLYGRMIADTDVVSVGIEILSSLPIGSFMIKINHRKLLDGMMEICGVPESKYRTIGSAIDKLDKESWEDVRKEMIEKKGLPAESADKIGQFVLLKGNCWEVYNTLIEKGYFKDNKQGSEALEDLRIFFEYIESMGYLNYLSFDLSLARGLDYYTGLIYEAVMTSECAVGSIAAGGRYDNLVGMFTTSDKQTPCVGISIGVERVFAIMEENAKSTGGFKCTPCQVFVASAGNNMTTSRMSVASLLWKNNISAEFQYSENPKLPKQLAYALEKGINWVVIVGEEEMKNKVVNLKNLETHEEFTIPLDKLPEELVSKGVKITKA